MIWPVPRLKMYKCRFSGENCDDSAVPSVLPPGGRRLGPSPIRNYMRICVYLGHSHRFAVSPLP